MLVRTVKLRETPWCQTTQMKWKSNDAEMQEHILQNDRASKKNGQ